MNSHPKYTAVTARIWFVAIASLFVSFGSPVLTGQVGGNVGPGRSPELDVLIRKIRGFDAEERAEAARRLGEMGEVAAPAVPFLIQALEDNRSVRAGESVSSLASLALAKIGEHAVEPCIRAFMKHPSVGQIENLHRTVSQFRDQRAIDELISLLANPDRDVREATVLSLQHSSDPRLVIPIVRLFHDRDEYVSRSAVWHFEKHQDHRVTEPLLDVLTARDGAIRQDAVRSLRVQRDPRVRPRLLEILQNDKESDDVRCAAAETLAKIGGEGVSKILLATFEDQTATISLRCWAAWGLGYLREPVAAQSLEVLLKNRREPPPLRVAAVRAIVNVDGKRAIPVLSEVAADESDDGLVCFWAAVSVGKLANGAIDDVKIVRALSGHDQERTTMGKGEAWEAAELAFQAVVERGRTRAVRSAATRKLLEMQGIEPGTDPLVILTVVYYLGGLSSWAWCCRKRLKQRQVTLRSLLVLVTIVAIGLPLVIAAIHV